MVDDGRGMCKYIKTWWMIEEVCMAILTKVKYGGRKCRTTGRKVNIKPYNGHCSVLKMARLPHHFEAYTRANIGLSSHIQPLINATLSHHQLP